LKYNNPLFCLATVNFIVRFLIIFAFLPRLKFILGNCKKCFAHKFYPAVGKNEQWKVSNNKK